MPDKTVQDAHAEPDGTIQQHGVPVAATDEEPTGMPDSGRHHSETAVHPEGGDASHPRHDHGTDNTPPG